MVTHAFQANTHFPFQPQRKRGTQTSTHIVGVIWEIQMIARRNLQRWETKAFVHCENK